MSDSAIPAPDPAAIDPGMPAAAPETIIEPVAEPPHTETQTLLTGERPAEPAAPEPAPATGPGAEPAVPAEEGEKPAEAKPDDAAKPVDPAIEAKHAEPIPEPAAPEPLVYEPPTVPEGVQLDTERIRAFDEIIAPHRLAPEARQQLVDMHIAEVQRLGEQMRADQHRTFGETRRAWRDQVLADEQIGGAGHQTALAACFRMIDLFVPETQRAEFDQMLLATGAGDHPAMLRLLHNLARKFDAPTTPAAPANPSPDRGGGAGRGRRMREMYDHPRSQTG